MTLPINAVPVLEKDLIDLNTAIDYHYMLETVTAVVETNEAMIDATYNHGPCDE